jgi:TetR/AcrR family transcriptional regulator, transcriptional repressor of aconitase
MAGHNKTDVLFCKVRAMPKISEEQKQQRIERVLAGARRCFARHGYEGATVARLEDEIGISRGAIFNWFPSKEELFVELARRDNDRLLTLFAEEGFDALVRAMTAEDADWLAVYLEFGRRLRSDAAFRERWKERATPDVRERVRNQLEEAQATGRLRDDLTTDDLGRFMGLVLDGIVVQRGMGFDPPDPDVVVVLVEDAIRGRGRARRRTRDGRSARA